MVVVFPVLGSVMVIVPALPASTVSVALVDELTTWDVIEAPEPVLERVKVGEPGVPGVQLVKTPVSVTV